LQNLFALRIDICNDPILVNNDEAFTETRPQRSMTPTLVFQLRLGSLQLQFENLGVLLWINGVLS
jgi:hypothetical protein